MEFLFMLLTVAVVAMGAIFLTFLAEALKRHIIKRWGSDAD